MVGSCGVSLGGFSGSCGNSGAIGASGRGVSLVPTFYFGGVAHAVSDRIVRAANKAAIVFFACFIIFSFSSANGRFVAIVNEIACKSNREHLAEMERIGKSGGFFPALGKGGWMFQKRERKIR